MSERAQAEVEQPTPFKCGTFGASTLADRHLCSGDFKGHVSFWDLERLRSPLFTTKGHESIINCVDGCGGSKGAGAPEVATEQSYRVRAPLGRRCAAAP